MPKLCTFESGKKQKTNRYNYDDENTDTAVNTQKYLSILAKPSGERQIISLNITASKLSTLPCYDPKTTENVRKQESMVEL